MPKIETMFAFVADGQENGIVAYRTPTGEWFPLVGSTIDRAISYMPFAQSVADETGQSMRLVMFERGREVQRITPAGKVEHS